MSWQQSRPMRDNTKIHSQQRPRKPPPRPPPPNISPERKKHWTAMTGTPVVRQRALVEKQNRLPNATTAGTDVVTDANNLPRTRDRPVPQPRVRRTDSDREQSSNVKQSPQACDFVSPTSKTQPARTLHSPDKTRPSKALPRMPPPPPVTRPRRHKIDTTSPTQVNGVQPPRLASSRQISQTLPHHSSLCPVLKTQPDSISLCQDFSDHIYEQIKSKPPVPPRPSPALLNRKTVTISSPSLAQRSSESPVHRNRAVTVEVEVEDISEEHDELYTALLPTGTEEDTPLDNYVVMQPSSLDKGTPPLEDERASPPSLEEEGYMTINRDELEDSVYQMPSGDTPTTTNYQVPSSKNTSRSSHTHSQRTLHSIT